MSASHLAIVSDAVRVPLPADAIGQRIRDLRLEARKLAREQVEMLHQSLIETHNLAAEIAMGGEAYGVGARELARRVAEDVGHQAVTLGAILERERD